MSDYIQFASALRKLLASDDRRREFEDEATREKARERLKVPEPMANEIANVLADLGRPAAPADAAMELRARTKASMDGAQTFIDNSFRQLRTALRISHGMSILIFAMGFAFLGIAAWRAIAVPEGVGGTAVVAGIGVVQIVALFYRNPLRDVGRAVSNAQQSKMVLMTYMLGVSLIGEDVYHGTPTADAGKRLREMTDDLVALLERYTEDRPAPDDSGGDGDDG
ncbi:MAG: hypothetical protein ABFS86_13375 [Planctomycetota bacterium]